MYSCTRAERTPSCSCVAWARWLTTALKRFASRTSAGYGANAQRVSHGSAASMAASAPANAKTVPTRLTAPKPTSERTAATSLDARDISSPVGFFA